MCGIKVLPVYLRSIQTDVAANRLGERTKNEGKIMFAHYYREEKVNKQLEENV